MTTIMRMTAVESGPTIRSISLNCDPRKYTAIAKAELQTAVPAADQRKNRAIPIFRRPAGMEIIVLTLGSQRDTKTEEETRKGGGREGKEVVVKCRYEREHE